MSSLVLGVTTSPAQGAEVEIRDLHHDGDRYFLSIEARIDASPLAVFAVVTDYDGIHRLHRRVRESRVVGRLDARTTEVFTLLRGCVAALFCKTIRRVERVTESPPGGLVATVIPEKSDLRYGEVRWRLEPDGEGTVLHYDSEVEPDFWVPAILGDALFKRSLGRTTTRMIETVEALARELSVGGGEPWQRSL